MTVCKRPDKKLQRPVIDSCRFDPEYTEQAAQVSAELTLL
jgi:hypothetical protein